MRYLIDGYNLLFRLVDPGDSFQSYRDSLIKILQKQAVAKRVNLTLVFDAHYAPDDECRTHQGRLEIVYTDPGETADNYILNHLKKGTVVVTSDKQLAKHVVHGGCETLSVVEFISWMKHKIGPSHRSHKMSKKLFDYYLGAFEQER